MLFKHTLLLLAAVTTTLAHDLANRVAQPDLSQRDPIARGGWSLALNGSATNDTCPADAPPCGARWCCPLSPNCITTADAAEAEACCDSPDNGDQCIQDFSFLANTTCADSSWVLWNATTAGYPTDFFCCLPGQLGTDDGSCVSPGGLDGAGVGILIAATSTSSSTKGGSKPTATTSGSSSETASGSSSAAATATGKSDGVGLRIFGTAVFARVLGAGFAVALL